MATTRSEFSVSADKYRKVVKAQRELLDAIAARVERGEPVARSDERRLIAGILRAWAHQIPDAAPNATTKVDPAYIAIHFAVLMNAEGQDKGGMLTPFHTVSTPETSSAPTMTTHIGPKSVSKWQTRRSLRANSRGIARTAQGATENRRPGTCRVSTRRPPQGMCTRW